MIAWLEGTLREKTPVRVVVDVNGVGYELQAPMTTFYTLPQTGEAVKLHTHQIVRDDAHQLYGFAERRDRDVFRMLLKVSGVGAKIGLAILSGMDARAFSRCIFEGDTASLSRLPGLTRWLCWGAWMARMNRLRLIRLRFCFCEAVWRVDRAPMCF